MKHFSILLITIVLSIFCVELSAQENPFMEMAHRPYREYVSRLDREYGVAAVEQNDSVWAATAAMQMHETAAATGDKKWELEARFIEFQARYFRELHKIQNDRNAEEKVVGEVKRISAQARRAGYADLQLRVEYFIFSHYWHTMENHEKALLQWDNVERLLSAVSAEDFQLKPYYFTRIATLHLAFDQYEKALDYYNKALEAPEVAFEQGHWEWLINELGLIYRHHYNDLERSDSCFRAILETVHDTISFIGYPDLTTIQERTELWQALAKGNLATNHFWRGEYDEAVPLLIESMDGVVKNNTNNYPFAAGKALDLALIYVRNGNLSEVMCYTNKALEWLNTERGVSRAHNIHLWQYYYHVCLDYYRATGDHANAWLYNDSLEIATNIVQEEYNLQQLLNAEKQITQMESERRMAAIRQQRMVIAGLSVVCAALILIAALVIWSRKRIAAKNKGLYLKIKEQDKLSEALERERMINRTLRIKDGDNNVERSEQEMEDEKFEKLTALMREERLFTKSDIKRADIAQKVGIGDRRLHDCIKNNTGMSFMDYINHLRLSYSRELIVDLSEKLTIEGIAMKSGFNSRTTFYRLFLEKYGLSPDEFKKMARKAI